MKRLGVSVLALGLAACTPPAQEPPATRNERTGEDDAFAPSHEACAVTDQK